ncbi:MAG: thioredoxin domain-containing protein [Gammaproteobacteria bacterium]
MIRTCPACGTSNRIPTKHLADNGRCGNCRAVLPAASEPVDVDPAQFDAILNESPVPVLVDFWAPWCSPCRMAAPEVHAAAASMAGRALVLKVNTDEHPDLANRYGIRGIPNFMVFRGGAPIWQHAGLLRRAQLEEVLGAV